MNAILSQYQHLRGDHVMVFTSLCDLISEKSKKPDWSAFTSSDWLLFRNMAINEGVAPFVHFLLNAHSEFYNFATFDRTVYQQFANEEAITAIKNKVYFDNLKKVLIVLSKNKIAVVLLKGADLANSIYPSHALRPMSDLDILVMEKDFNNALELINDLGYHEYLPEVLPNFNRAISHHAHLKKESAIGIVLELHWILVATPAFRHAVSMEWFWENIRPIQEWNDSDPLDRVYGLNPTANLMYLSAHQMIQHGGENASLRWMLDLHRLIIKQGKEINWQMLAAQAGEFGWSSALQAALQSVEDIFGTPLPVGVCDQLSVNTNETSALVRSKSVISPTHTIAEWKKMRSLRWGGRLRFIAAMVFPSPAYMRWRYPSKSDWSLPVNYLKRWSVIFLDAIKTIKNICKKSIR